MKRAVRAEKRRPIYSGVTGTLAKAFDATLAIVAPRLVHSMQVARMKSAALIAHEAAEVNRLNPKQVSSSADGEILPDLPRLRELSRALVRDDAHASSTMNILDETVVSEGIVPQSACTPEATGLTDEQCQDWRAQCEARWKRWAEDEADATEVGTFYDLQSLALRCWLQDGDSLSHALIGGDFMLSCELIDADRLESPGFYDTDKIRAGVELGDHGERVAFHVLPQHPDDFFLAGNNKPRAPIRIPANDRGYSIVQQVFKRTRPGQTRGVPLFTPSLLYGRHLHHYLDSELIAARSASNFAMFIKRAVTPSDPDLMPVQDNEKATGQDFHEFLEPGTIEYLNEGEEPVPYTPNRPGTQFEPFVIRILRAMCASSGLSYEIVCRDFGRMNLSSARAMLREVRRGCDLMRRRLVRGFCQPWWNNVIRMGVASGELRPPGRFLDDPKPFLAAIWVPPSYGMVDPKTDVEASTLAVASNLSTQWEEAAKQGGDAEHNLRERARFHRLQLDVEKEHDLPPGTLDAPKQGQGSQPKPGNEVEPADEQEEAMP